MSVNPVSGGSELSVEQKKAQYEEQYEEYNTIYTSLINDDKYHDYFAENGALKPLKDALEEALNNLRHALDGVYDEEKIDALMRSLGDLLVGNTALMGLEARIAAYVALLGLKDENKITEDDYNALLAVLNSPENLNKEKFDKLLDIAQSRKTKADFLTENKSKLGSRTEALEEALGKTISELLEYSLEELDNYNNTLNNLHLVLEKALIDVVTFISDTQRAIQSATLSMKVMQANNAYRDIESQLQAEANLEAMAQKNENLKRFREEGAWQDSNIKRRQEVLQEGRLQKAKEAEQKSKSENI